MARSSRAPGSSGRFKSLLAACWVLLALALFAAVAAAEDCSASKPCAVGCCSKFGYCGWGDDFCGTGCLSSCDAKKDCDASRPCKFGCCSKHGFCGLGGDFCSPDNCAAGCETKSQCDPGWGLQYSNASRCALNVCCSKHGFCGTTPEFCGDAVVKRPSCGASGRMKRVIGYYEGWAPNRPCNRVYPEDITPGVYTHINFAFASINPSTFAVTPGGPDDDQLWTRMQTLRFMDPGVQVWLAIGGWTFNDDDQPTRYTFSDIVNNESLQDKFIHSLIGVIQAYNFQGVDLDWEYPGAPDRSGRPTDFAKFPGFLRRLRGALQNVNPGYGVSITIPISFWYLQHFDIKSLQGSVDWFNVMSYDLHGKWDLSTDYGKVYEITEMLDLLWRNDIDPSMVTLGLAFYGRSATASSAGCVQPGCPFVSAGRAGACSGEAGVLLNTEIDTIISDNGLTPVFDRKAAVKHISWGDQWVSFDDADTFKLKADAARSLCLGGVMVWAISHDTPAGTYSLALAEALGHERVQRPGGSWWNVHGGLSSKMTTRRGSPQDEYCRWSGCSADPECPSGFSLVANPYYLGYNLYSTQCPAGNLRAFCCPKNKPPPRCLWRGDASCNGGCPDGEVEVGTSTVGCPRNGYSSLRCGETTAIKPYADCKWVGSAPNCGSGGDGSCPSGFPHSIATSTTGSGGLPACVEGTYSYCCKTKGGPPAFRRCQGPPLLHKLRCDDSCPVDTIQIARHSESCIPGTSLGTCCKGEVDNSEKNDYGRGIANAQVQELKFYLDEYYRNPQCPASVSSLQRRALAYRQEMSIMSFETLKLILVKVFSAPRVRPDMQDMLNPYFFGRDMASVDELHSWIDRRERDPSDVINDFLCDRVGYTRAMRRRDRVEFDLCYEYWDVPHTRRDLLPSSSSNESSAEIAKRRIFDDEEDDRRRHPQASAIFRGIERGDLTFHYARFVRLSRERHFILEVVYHIGTSLFETPSTPVRTPYIEPNQVWQRWVVFHIHFHSETHRRILENPNNSMFRSINRVAYPVADSVNMFHSGSVQPFRIIGDRYADTRVGFRDRRRGGANERRILFSCDREGDGHRAWPVGSDTTPTNTPLGRQVRDWGVRLRNDGIADLRAFTYIFPNANLEASEDFGEMDQRRYAPLEGAFQFNFGHDGLAAPATVEQVAPSDARVEPPADPDQPWTEQD